MIGIRNTLIAVFVLVYLGFLWFVGSLLLKVWEALDLYLRTAP